MIERCERLTLHIFPSPELKAKNNANLIFFDERLIKKSIFIIIPTLQYIKLLRKGLNVLMVPFKSEFKPVKTRRESMYSFGSPYWRRLRVAFLFRFGGHLADRFRFLYFRFRNILS